MNTLPPVCILTAGKGTRMGLYTESINKALLPLNDRAIISHILEKFPSDTEFVIAVGYLQDQVRDYLEIAHPNKNITFVEVENYDGPGSGPGHSLMCCRAQLERPFYFVSCDTLWDNDLPMPLEHSWLGVAPVPIEEAESYCMLRIEEGRITESLDKQPVHDSSHQAFVGLCYIYDYEVYWNALEKSDLVAGELQMSTALQTLIAKCDVRPQPVDWTDVGNFEKYKQAVLQYADYDFSKSEELFYRLGSKIIKYFVDHSVTDNRVAKAKMHPSVFPTITDHLGGFYAYAYQPGETLYEVNSPDIFRELLQWLEASVWDDPAVEKGALSSACHSFYKEKTLQRLALYDQKFPEESQPSVINGNQLPPLKELLAKIPWDALENEGVPSFIHGDLQFDNILYDKETDKFTLLDWRQDFAGNVAFGDLYYDLAKLRGGIILNYDYIKQNMLHYEEAGQCANFDFAQRFQTNTYLEILDNYVLKRSLDLNRVRLLTIIIYLNMSPLHHYPFDKMLHALGHEMLAGELG